jgi:hypothetical protein
MRVGADGLPAGAIPTDGSESLDPAELNAVTTNVYVTPFVNPVTLQLVVIDSQ